MPNQTRLPGSKDLRRWGGTAILLLGLPVAAATADPGADFGTILGTDLGVGLAAGSSADGAKKAADSLAIGSRTEKPDGSTALTVGRRLDTDWDAEFGVDVGLAPPLTAMPTPEAHLDGWARQDRSTGAGWASVLLPAAPPGWDKASVETRIDPAQDQGKVAATLSRSMPLGSDARVTIRNNYSLIQTLPSSGTPGQTLVTEGMMSLDVLSSATTFSAGAKFSTDDKWLPTLSAEQKLFGTPLSVTGTVSGRSTGETDRSIKARIKRTW